MKTRSTQILALLIFGCALASCGAKSRISGHYAESGNSNVQLDIDRSAIVISAPPLKLTFPYTVESTNGDTINISYSGENANQRFHAQIHANPYSNSIQIDGGDFHGTTYVRR